MIALRRYRVKPPPYLREVAAASTRELESQRKALQAQERLRFDDKVLDEFKPLLRELGTGKCAYCESALSSHASSVIDHYRPIRSVAESPDHPGYYWLAYTWENLLPACGVCMRNKRDWFPLRNEESRVSAPTKDLRLEHPLLLDPSSQRFVPWRHLIFNAKTGEILPKDIKGETTIKLLGLNREELVKARRQHARKVEASLIKVYKRRGPVEASPLEVRRHTAEFIGDEVPFAGIARQVVESFIDVRVKKPQRVKMEEAIQEILINPAEIEERIASEVLVPGGTIPSIRGYVSRIEVRNFRCINKLGLKFSPSASGGKRAGWQMLLGENGTGKSSLLQAIALTLGGRRNLEASWLARQEFLGDGKKRGSIQIWLSTSSVPIRLNLALGRLRYARDQDGVGMFLRAYGAIRLPPGPKNDLVMQANPEERRVIRNLFDPFAPLCDATSWLADLNDADFDRAARTLKDVLTLGNTENITLTRTNGVVAARTPQRSLGSLRTLSRGQQAVLDLAADLMCGMMKETTASGEMAAPNDFQRAEGIVLLDEIDAHLHPRWKMEIVGSLRRAFPNLQFLASTHEPLCLRGLEGGEIVIMRNEGNGLEADVTEISPVGWRVDQLLTSPLFGLNTTIDPAVEADFQELYSLMAKRQSELGPDQAARLMELREKVKAYNRLGFTRRDQLLYEVIDECLATEIRTPLGKQAAIHEKTKKRVATLWRKITTQGFPK